MCSTMVMILLSSCYYILFGISFSIVYRTVRFFNFAHAAIYTTGPYCILLFARCLGISFAWSVPLSIILCCVLGCMTELIIYRPLRKKGSSSLVLLLSSLGIYLVLQNVISIVFGDDVKTIRGGLTGDSIRFFGTLVTPIQIAIIAITAISVASVTLLLKKTRIGKALRAVANDVELAEVSGIESKQVILWAFALSSALAGLAGILVALDLDMTPTMGLNALMMGVVVVIMGGVGSIPGLLLGALLLATAQHLTVWKIGSQWQDAVAFFVLLIFLLFRPEGFFGKKIRKATI